jgi:peptidoglycan hydrolase-like protein with peptidoglycan-binding domain
VVWAQEHLNGAGQSVAVSGTFDAATQQAVQQFQSGAGLPPTGVIDTATWNALLTMTPVAVDWTSSSAPSGARAARRREGGPATARLPARRYEIGRADVPGSP